MPEQGRGVGGRGGAGGGERARQGELGEVARDAAPAPSAPSGGLELGEVHLPNPVAPLDGLHEHSPAGLGELAPLGLAADRLAQIAAGHRTVDRPHRADVVPVDGGDGGDLDDLGPHVRNHPRHQRPRRHTREFQHPNAFEGPLPRRVLACVRHSAENSGTALMCVSGPHQ